MNSEDIVSRLRLLIPDGGGITLAKLGKAYRDKYKKFRKEAKTGLNLFLNERPTVFSITDGRVRLSTPSNSLVPQRVDGAPTMATRITDSAGIDEDDLLLVVKKIVWDSSINITKLCEVYAKDQNSILTHQIEKIRLKRTKVKKWLKSFPMHFTVSKENMVTLPGLMATAQSFQEKADACREDRKDHLAVVDTIASQLKKKMEGVARVLSGGSIAKGTNVKGKADCDIVMLFNLKPTDDWFSLLQQSLETARDKLKRTPSVSFRNQPSGSRHVAFTQNRIDVDLLAGILFKSQKDYETFYAQQMAAKQEHIAWLNPSACEWQVNEIRPLAVWIKDIIRVLKAWRDGVFKNKDVPGWPKSYLIELLVKHTVGTGADQDRIKIIHKFFDFVERQPTEIFDSGNKYNNIVKDFDWRPFVKKAKLARPAGADGPLFLI
eukprot:GILJ01006832.1.p1 GENE.GILJ01006832.1~~GILJ01006832.1.p1  ORF type:complete len:447 (-),score=56.03 GILJ01006832.1:158-1459(-)